MMECDNKRDSRQITVYKEHNLFNRNIILLNRLDARPIYLQQVFVQVAMSKGRISAYFLLNFVSRRIVDKI